MALSQPDKPAPIFTEHWTKAGPVIASMSDRDLHALDVPVEATLAGPGGFSLFGFALGTALIAIPLAGILPPAQVNAALPAVLLCRG